MPTQPNDSEYSVASPLPHAHALPLMARPRFRLRQSGETPALLLVARGPTNDKPCTNQPEPLSL